MRTVKIRVQQREAKINSFIRMADAEGQNKELQKAVSSEAISAIQERHLSWSDKQGHILTGGGKAEEYFTADRGFPFQDDELPHHYLSLQKTHDVFSGWRMTKDPCLLVTGAWKRPLFVGGWDHTTDQDEDVYNIQTNNLFVDLRIPKSRSQVFLSGEHSSLEGLTPVQLRLYARQHVFAGFCVFSRDNDRPLCTRHHCIDWNYVGYPRSRPNKWWIELKEGDKSTWKEYAYATDDRNQHYYFERWQHLDSATTQMPRLALRKAASHPRDGVLVIVGDHFNYVLARELKLKTESKYEQKSLVDLVDAAIEMGDVATARDYLSIEAGHGRVSRDWKLDCTIPPWNEGNPLWRKGQVKVEGQSIDNCHIVWSGEKWDLYDCSFNTVQELEHFLI